MSAPSLVWFKRDLRIEDHAPLTEACANGAVVLLYVYEPDIIGGEDFDADHLRFLNQSLQELQETLAERGGELICRVGRAESVLEALRKETGFTQLFSHEETGNALTYARDLRVSDWARSSGVRWRQYRQFGVTRKLKERDGWAARWNVMMAQPMELAPKRIDSLPGVKDEGICGPERFSLQARARTLAQVGGVIQGRLLLKSFLTERGAFYQSAMSSPKSAWTGCSRLSPYLAYGNLSMRHVYQALKARRQKEREQKAAGRASPGEWGKALSSFDKRLHWHCHFIQKLESEPEIEFENMARSHDGLRENEFDQERFEAWCAGVTGYPMVDACMRALNATGWLNFRMRAMVVSFASYHLWLHWRPTALYLAKAFLDYEPGIHYSQVQMQSGTTGINAIRVYSPIKQAKDQDPEGHFIRQWVPELSGVPDEHIAEPHRMTRDEQSKAGVWIGETYPEPIVEHLVAYRHAQARVRAVRRTPEARAEAQRINTKHGSRRRSERQRRGDRRFARQG